MFEQTFVQTQAQTRKPWTVAVSLSLQCAVVGVLLLIPLLDPQTMLMPGPPQPHLIRTWITQPPVPVRKASPHAGTISTPALTRPFVYVPPTSHPTQSPEIDLPAGDPDVVAWSGTMDGSAFGPALPGTTLLPPRAELPKPAPAPVTPKTAASGPLKISQGVAGARLIFRPAPAYPQLAKIARSEGVVKLEATIAADGTIRNLRVVSGPPLLTEAAMNAVRQWRYRPTLLNGNAVEVLTEIDVNFSLTK